MTWKKSAAILTACLGLLTWLHAQRPPSAAERQLFDEANRARKAQGLPPLKWDESLAAAARRHAAEMASHGTISHQFPGEPSMPGRATKAGAHYSSLAENVAYGQGPDQVEDEWMKSAPHRANILDPSLDSLGVGVTERGGQTFAVEDFSKSK